MDAGTIIGGKYRVVSLLGRGGMGSVWRAVHISLDAPVAIKLIDAKVDANSDALARFHREAKAAAALRSPHVVQILDHGIDAATAQPFIAMELMEGESLATRLDRVGRLAPDELARTLTQVARAMARAHESGIVHRDLKPDNVFLVKNDDEEIAKVLDFGIAKSSLSLQGSGAGGLNAHASGVGATQTGAMMGTPYYMSPEQIGGSKDVDFRSDLWSLGVIAFECMTGRRPFEADTLGGLVLQICVGAKAIPSNFGVVPAGFDEWFERATARDPNARFASARELADALRVVCALQPTAPNPANVPFVAPRPSAGALLRTETGAPFVRTDATELRAPSSAPKWAGFVLLLVLATGGAIWWSRRAPPESALSTPSAAAPQVGAPSGTELARQREEPRTAPEPRTALDPPVTIAQDGSDALDAASAQAKATDEPPLKHVNKNVRPAQRKASSHDLPPRGDNPLPNAQPPATNQRSVVDDVLDQRQ